MKIILFSISLLSLFVIGYGTDNVFGHHVLDEIPVSSDPMGMSMGDGLLYVSSFQYPHISIIDTETNENIGFITTSSSGIMDVEVVPEKNQIYAEEYVIDIPFGAHNPELNTPAEVWYNPPQIRIVAGDTITWYNDDREGHTVTSGESSGRYGWMSDNFGTPDGLFDSDIFAPGNSWSYKFDEVGTFSYFCTIHPWMEGIVIVENKIPDYPHDATGMKIDFPLLQYTPDKNIEVNLSWHPPIIKTHEKIQFVYQFYDPQTNSNLAEMEYTFVIFQNGKELFRDEGLNQIGGDYRNFVFDESGSIIIRVQGIQTPSMLAEESVTVFGDVQSIEQRSVDFTAVVYDNAEKSSHEGYHVKPAQRLTLYYELMLFIILIPGVMFIAALLWLKKKPKIPDEKPGAVKL